MPRTCSASILLRGFLFVAFAGFAAMILFLFGVAVKGWAATGYRTTPAGVAGVAVLGALGLFLAVAALATLRFGRLVMHDDKALLPRVPFLPWCLFSPVELPLERVRRWGFGVAQTHGEVSMTVPILMFEVGDGKGGKRPHTLSLFPYSNADRQDILRYFEDRLPRVETLENGFFRGLHFRER